MDWPRLRISELRSLQLSDPPNLRASKHQAPHLPAAKNLVRSDCCAAETPSTLNDAFGVQDSADFVGRRSDTWHQEAQRYTEAACQSHRAGVP